MAKRVGLTAKTVERAPAKTADEWIAGVGERAAALESAPAAIEEKLKRLTIDIPESLHKEFKATCAARGVNMAEAVRALIEGDLKMK
ncbi:hypothetical protein EON80_09555 [bacterium]|nr:MAG: hypothetical protein EON80_09555 [bacterium]